MMLCSRFSGYVGAVLAVGALTAGTGLLAHPTAGARPQNAPAVGSVKASPSAPGKDDPSRKAIGQTGEIVVRAADLGGDFLDNAFIGMAAIDPETAKWRTIYKGVSMGGGPVSPGGRFIVAERIGRDVESYQAGIWVYDMTGEISSRRIFERRGYPFWVRNGRQVVISTAVDGRPILGKFETWRVNAHGTGRAKLPIPESDMVIDCSRDGTWLATRTIGGDPNHQGRLTLVRPDGTGARHLTEGSAKGVNLSVFKISPDSRSIVYVETKTQDDLRRCRLYIEDIEGRHRQEILVPFELGQTFRVCWSPDGSRLALNLIDDRTMEGRIDLVDRDGSNHRQLPLPPGRWNLQVCDWTALTPGLMVGTDDVPADPTTPRGRYQVLVQEREQAMLRVVAALRESKTDEERNRASRDWNSRYSTYDRRFLKIAESAPNDPAAIDALIEVVRFGTLRPEVSRAVDLLAQKHADTRKVGDAALSLGTSVSASAEKLLRAVIEKNPNRPLKGRACLALGRYLKRQSERVRSIREDPESAKAWEAMFLQDGADKATFARFKESDPDALLAQAEAALERTVKEFSDIAGPGDRLDVVAQTDLYEIRYLCPGKSAPEITGKDIDGQPFRLSDHRGKVVLLSFWADWCGPCQAQFPYERSLVERMRGRPFVLLGVNVDEDKDKLRELMTREHITWRSWWDGGGNANTQGAIVRQFNVHGWPTLYLVDHRGVIRHRFPITPSTKRLDSAIDALVLAAEEAAP
jgi:peroxiredoxin